MKNILVLDDNKEILEAVARRLGRFLKGCTIVTADDGAQGKEILGSMPIDLVLTDLAMPKENGFDLIEHAKKNYPRMPIFVMSANCSPQVISRLRCLGVARWFEKPFQFQVLARLIAEELNVEYND
jgi:DNA-binding NtrC family response regulator